MAHKHRERSEGDTPRMVCACGYSAPLGTEEAFAHLRTCLAARASAGEPEPMEFGSERMKPGDLAFAEEALSRAGSTEGGAGALAHFIASKFPPLGSVEKVYAVELTEPEINAVYAIVGFYRGQVIAQQAMAGRSGLVDAAGALIRAWWGHYGPTLEGLDQKLKQFDDGKPAA
jgi:hypothetical protein